MILNIALWLHFVGVVTLFIALAIVQLSGARARRASTVEEARTWLVFAGSTKTMFPTAFLTILLSGLYMAHKVYTFHAPWIVVAISVAVLMALTGGVVVGSALEGAERALRSGSGSLTAEQMRLVRQPRAWVTAGALNGTAFGLIWIMVSKPGWLHAAGAIGVAALLGAIIASSVARSGR